MVSLFIVDMNRGRRSYRTIIQTLQAFFGFNANGYLSTPADPELGQRRVRSTPRRRSLGGRVLAPPA
jgi:hypothetical protein